MEDLKVVDILLVEDNPGDVRLAEEALKDSKIKNNLYVANDGEQAIDFLRQVGEYAGKPKPDIILLDLNLPKKDGREVLAEIKNDDNLKVIPVVVITSSQAEEDILKSYHLHANCYIKKPLDMDQFEKIVKTIQDFWFTIVKLPPRQ